MPLAWPWAHVHVHTWRLSWNALLLLVLLETAVGDHHHHHRPARYGALGLQGVAQGLQGQSPIALLNPWLSACDLAQPHSSPDLQGACAAAMPDRHPHGHVHGPGHGPGHRVNGVIAEGPGPPDEEGCPRPCGDHDASNTQCLRYLRESNKDSVCGSMELDKFRLRHCCEHSVGRSLTPEALQAVRSSSSQCSHYLGALLELDTLAARLSCEFGEILTRYDCDHPYSVNFQCKHCQESYRRWVCSSLLPHFPKPGSSRMRPCRSVCRNVEQKCPFFLPGDRAPAYPTQYAGEPTFLCLDPNIPESGEQLVKSSYGEDDCCYEHCTQDKLPTLCARNTSCPPSEKTPPAVVCEPPPPAPTPAPGERTLPSACAASIAAPPPPPPPRSAGAVPMTDRCLLGLIGVLILHRLAVHAARVRVSSPARGPVALEAGAAAGAGDAAPSNRPRPHPWPRPRLRPRKPPGRSRRPPNWIRLRRRHHHRPFGPLRPSRMPTGAPLLQLLRRELLRTNRLGKRTTATVILSLFRFVEHIT